VPKLNLEQFVQEKYDASLTREMMRTIEDAINRLSEGRAYQIYNSASSAPSASGDTDAYTVGDFVKNNDPVELGTATGKYIITGWMCIADGTPGVWRESRTLTGN
jgi:hypothetical protein